MCPNDPFMYVSSEEFIRTIILQPTFRCSVSSVGSSEDFISPSITPSYLYSTLLILFNFSSLILFASSFLPHKVIEFFNGLSEQWLSIHSTPSN